jgi:uncharacterized protein (DUF433 family)
MTYQDHIASDPAVCGGQPVIRGTRVLVRTVLGYLAQGEGVDAILRDFRTLKEADVRGVITFAGASASDEVAPPTKLRIRRPPENG